MTYLTDLLRGVAVAAVLLCGAATAGAAEPIRIGFSMELTSL